MAEVQHKEQSGWVTELLSSASIPVDKAPRKCNTRKQAGGTLGQQAERGCPPQQQVRGQYAHVLVKGRASRRSRGKQHLAVRVDSVCGGLD